MLYIDSSFLLSILLDQKNKDAAVYKWNNDFNRVSSILLDAECSITLKRYNNFHSGSVSEDWLSIKNNLLEEFLDEVEIRVLDEVIIKILKSEQDIDKCRSSDAVHLATACSFRSDFPNEDISICTYDKTMMEVAKMMDFKVI
jgi:predicted nucleic acid-binding protein